MDQQYRDAVMQATRDLFTTVAEYMRYVNDELRWMYWTNVAVSALFAAAFCFIIYKLAKIEKRLNKK